MKKKTIINLLIGIIFSLGSLYVLFSKFSLTDLEKSFEHINYFWLSLSIISIILSMVVRTKIWAYLLGEYSHKKIRQLFYTLMFCYALNNVLPARMGDLSRIYICWKKTKQSRSYITLTLVIEKLFDLIWLGIFLVVVLYFMRNNVELIYHNALLFICSMIVVVVVFLLLFKFRNFILNRIQIYFQNFSFISRLIAKFTFLFASVPAKQVLIKAISLHCMTWILSLIAVWFSTKAFNLNVGIIVALLILVLTNLGMLVPSTPGAIGVYHYLTYLALTISNVDNVTASTFAIFIHLVQYVTIIVCGLSARLVEGLEKTDQEKVSLKHFLKMENSSQ